MTRSVAEIKADMSRLEEELAEGTIPEPEGWWAIHVGHRPSMDVRGQQDVGIRTAEGRWRLSNGMEFEDWDYLIEWLRSQHATPAVMRIDFTPTHEAVRLPAKDDSSEG